ncbi:MAG: chitobiase/beta-hexosaminidase C-terminal domain-containing protein [Deltaproteobacteria bacterium]|nr:chitobiase/beta-hexosaminidase C-terminal domain-containing protein [Deltaproteobacteria bacterium]
MKPTLLAVLMLLLALAACGRTSLDESGGPSDAAAVVPPDAAASAPVPAKTTLSPPPGPFNEKVEVTLTTDKPAKLLLTTDGSDPRSSSTRREEPAPFALVLDKTTTLAFFSITPDGAEEAMTSVMYVRAGGPKGTVSGVVIVGPTALGHEVGIAGDLQTLKLGAPLERGEIPFLLTDLGTGAHRLVPYSDTNDDGLYLPFLDLSGAAYGFELDLDDPFRASLEGVKLYLGTSQPGLCTLQGKVSFPVPVPNLNLSVAAFDPNVLMGGGADPTTLLSAFGDGYRVTTNDIDTEYPYAIFDLPPGQYLAVPALLGALGGLQLNLLVDLGGSRSCAQDGLATADFAFGQVELTGSVAYTPASPAAFAYGAIVARSFSFSMQGPSAQVALMPAFLFSDGAVLQGSFSAQALRDGQTFELRAFTSLDAASGANPLVAAFSWALNPFAPEPPQGSFVATPPSQAVSFTAP